MDLAKSYEFFNPNSCQEALHIIGCGSVGSTVAELLARFGLENIRLWDFDVVESHNLVNQMFTTKDLYQPKTKAVKSHLVEINPALEETIEMFEEGWKGQNLSGYVFLCVDNIDLRREIVTKNKFNNTIKAIFDFRTGLTEFQHYAADWGNMEHKTKLLKQMEFTHKEAEEAVPMSACHVPLCVAPTVRMVSNVGVCNFINFVKSKQIKTAMVGDAFKFFLEEL